MIETSRRSFFKGVGALIAAPAIVKFMSLMPVKLFEPVFVNSLLTIDMVTRQAVELFTNSNAFIKHLDEDVGLFDDFITGSQFQIRLPKNYLVNA